MMKTLFSLFFLSLVMACTAQNEKITRIDIEKMTSMSTDEHTVILDVRTPGEVSEGYIKGTSKFIDYNGANFDVEIEALDKDKTYIVYCRSGNRSTKALNIMADQGFTNLYELKGGITAVSDPELIIK